MFDLDVLSLERTLSNPTLGDPEKGRFEATRSRSMVAEAREIALRLLKEHEVPQLDRSVMDEGDRIIRDHEKAITS